MVKPSCTLEDSISEDDLYELRMTKSEHNPRFILTTATPQCFVVLHAFMKKYDGAIREKEKFAKRINS
ncbi:type II toxin-antitoxin system RelE/ParE family toxin [Tolypothrix bouteillei]|nr:type II toxin-antitoxin system RelE/ParE family toxin [Tolypothrix bouteillei]